MGSFQLTFPHMDKTSMPSLLLKRNYSKSAIISKQDYQVSFLNRRPCCKPAHDNSILKKS